MLRPFYMHVGKDSSWKCWDEGTKQNRRRPDGWRQSLLISHLCLHPPGLFIHSAALHPLSSLHCSPVEEDLTAAFYTSQDAPTTVVSFKWKDNWQTTCCQSWWDFETPIFVRHCLTPRPTTSPPGLVGVVTDLIPCPDYLAASMAKRSNLNLLRCARRQSGLGRVDSYQTCLISRLESPDCAATRVGEGGNDAWEGTTMMSVTNCLSALDRFFSDNCNFALMLRLHSLS